MRSIFLCTFLFLLPTMANAERYPADELVSGDDVQLVRDQFKGRRGLNVAIYRDTGVWSVGYDHLKLFFRQYDHSYTSIDADDILGGWLQRERPDVLVMPGGSSWKYLEKLDEDGANAVREFVANGGGYVGICAGAFYATSLREGGYATGPYGIGLLEGTAFDGTALDVPPYKEGMMDFDMVDAGYPETQRMVLLGGPSMQYDAEEAAAKNVVVVAEFQGVEHPAMVVFEFGEGKVFLSGPHLEVEENRWSRYYYDPETDWPLLNDMMQRVSN